MTQTKTILGVSLAAAFTISMLMAQGALADDERASHLVIDDVSFTTVTDDGEDFLKVVIETDGPVKNNGQYGAYGYGVLTNGGENVLALTTHMCAADSPHQGDASDDRCPNSVGLVNEEIDLSGVASAIDGPLFHAHVLDLKGATANCAGVDNASPFEVDIEGSLVNNGGVPGVSPDYPVKTSGAKITAGNIPTSVLGGSIDGAATVSFEIVGLPNVAGTGIGHLCLTNLGS